MIKITNIKIKADLSDDELFEKIYKKYKINKNDVTERRIIKKSIDARNKADIFYNYSVELECKNENKIKNVQIVKKEEPFKIIVNRKSSKRPVIIGAGPAGLFSALTLAQNGIKPIIIEQGKTVDERKKDVEEFQKTGKLNTLSNVQFGEGGAGTFSDGKLTSGIHNPLCKIVLKEFYNFGAPEQILYINKPHIGTDNLINIIRNMRNEIIKLGGEFLFNEKVTDFEFENSKVTAVICGKRIETDTVILAIGHSARSTFEKLYEKGVKMEKKNFSIGVRIEHKQSMINKSQYGEITKLKLPPAEYKMAYHGENRSCYTFCMCPGGVVVAASSEKERLAVNGMSYFARDKENANSALLVSIQPEDFGTDDVLGGVELQRKIEHSAYVEGGENYNAPVQKVGDFLKSQKTLELGDIKPSYKPAVTPSDFKNIFPDYMYEALQEGIKTFDKQIKGFAQDNAIMTAVESRSSSPVRIVRNTDFNSVSIKGLYPCGEGCGYAGGIMSAAVDGIKCAIAVLTQE